MLEVLWCAAIVIKGAAACRMAVNGVIKTLPLVWVYVTCTFAYVAVLLAVSSFPSLYLETYSVSVPFLLAVECTATASIFWRLTGAARRLRIAGTATLCILTVAGAAAAWAISFLGKPVHAGTTVVWLWYAALVVQRYVSTITASFLLGVLLLLPRSPGRLPRVAIHAAWIMIFDALMRLSAAMFARLYGYSRPWMAALVPLVSAALAGLAWLTLRNYEEPSSGPSAPEESAPQEGRLAFERDSIRGALEDAMSTLQRDR
jgi:hypothetical protein